MAFMVWKAPNPLKHKVFDFTIYRSRSKKQ